MSPQGFKFMMNIICELLNKKNNEINANFYSKQLAEVDVFIDDDVLKAVDVLAKEEVRLPQNIIAYIHKHAMIFSSKRRLQEKDQEPKKNIEDYDEKRKEIRKKNITKITELGKKCMSGEISTKRMYEEFDKDCPNWFKRTVFYTKDIGNIVIDMRTNKPYCPQREKEMWNRLEKEENSPVDRSKNLIGNVVGALPNP